MPTNVEEIESKKRHILNVFMKRKFHFFLFFTQKSEKNKKKIVFGSHGLEHMTQNYGALLNKSSLCVY